MRMAVVVVMPDVDETRITHVFVVPVVVGEPVGGGAAIVGSRLGLHWSRVAERLEGVVVLVDLEKTS